MFGAASGYGADRGLPHPSRKRCARATPNKKEKGMKRNLVRWFVVSLFAVGFGVAAQAQEPDHLVVNVPYDFVVNGKLLPPGKYKVQRYGNNDLRQLVLVDSERKTSVITLASQVRDVRELRPSITFAQAGDHRFLTQIRTAEHIFVIPGSEAAFEAAAAKLDRTNYLAGTSESPKR